MIRPFKGDFKLTQTFGNVFILNGVNVYAQWGLLGHNGIDWGLPVNTPLIAPHNGVKKEIAYDQGGFGWYVKIESEKEGSVICHMSSRPIGNVGDLVKEGDPIGFSGNSGFSTAPHVHWGYYLMPRDRGNGYNGYIDQMPFLNLSDNEGSDDNMDDTIYKGLDLTNRDSMKIAVDIWYAVVREGQYITQKEHEEVRQNLLKCQSDLSNNQNSSINEQVLKQKLIDAKTEIEELNLKLKNLEKSSDKNPVAEGTKTAMRNVLLVFVGNIMPWAYSQFPILGVLEPNQQVMIGLAVSGILWYVDKYIHESKGTRLTGIVPF